MSLLLDALKKAAEQKAQKSREPVSGRMASDDTLMLDETRTEVVTEAELSADKGQLDDTRLQHSYLDETQTRIPSDDDETDIRGEQDKSRFEQTRRDQTGAVEATDNFPADENTDLDHDQLQYSNLDETLVRMPPDDELTDVRSELDDSGFEQTMLEQTVTDRASDSEPVDDSTLLDHTQLQHSSLDRTETRLPAEDEFTDVRSELDESGFEQTAFEQTVAEPASDSEPVDDSTLLDHTQLQHSSLDQTEIRLPAEDELTDVRTELDESSFEQTAYTQTVADPASDSEPVDDNTQLDHSQLQHSSLDQTEIRLPAEDELTDVRTELDESSFEQTAYEQTVADPATDSAATSDNTQLDHSQLQHSSLDQTEMGLPAEEELTDFSTNFDNSTQLDQLQLQPSIPHQAEINSDAIKARIGESGIDATEHDALQIGVDTTDFTQSEAKYGAENLEDSSEFGGDDSKDVELTLDDVTDFMGDFDEAVQQPEITAHEVTHSVDDTTGIDQYDTAQDLSLSPLDIDPTRTSGDVDPSHGADANPDLAADDETTSNIDFGLVDLTQQGKTGDDTDSLVSHPELTATTQTNAQTLNNEGVVNRPDNTATKTYAPDNYDRTLIKVPDEDASKIFAGMKSDAGVVMTPDYAKKVFMSKTSVQKAQYFKLYSAIGGVIFLVIGIFGLFELQQESESIDASLRPLKRDPMPGLIKNINTANPVKLFGDSAPGDIDTKTLELIQNAENSVTNETPVKTFNETVAGNDLSEISEQVATGKKPIAPASEKATTSARQTSSSSQISPQTLVASTTQSADNSQSFQLSSSSRITEKDKLLGDAYAAYQSGDDTLALSKYSKVLEIDPGNRNALLARAAISIHNQNISQAIQDYQQLLVANPKDSLAMTSLMSVANFSPKQAESQLRLMIREEPDSPYINFALANVLGAQNRWQEAQNRYFTALENNPNDPNYAYNLAVSLEHIAKPRVAISYYERALSNFDNGLATFNRDVVDQRLEILRQL